jgi:hypothetical protein
MGKNKKEHRKRVANRNKRVQDTQKRISKIWNEEIQKQIEMIRAEAEKEKISEETETNDGPI